MLGRRLANILIGLITLWAIYTIVAWLFDVSIMFPFVEVEPDEIPMGRMHAIRLAVIGTFAFYGLMHLLQGSSEVFPIHFLKTFLFFLSILGLAVAWKTQTDGTAVSLAALGAGPVLAWRCAGAPFRIPAEIPPLFSKEMMS